MITERVYEKSHNYCMVCGQDNHRSLGLKFTTDKNGITYSTFHGDNGFQGYNGILHGGIITTLLDATMTHCLFHHGIIALTGDLHVRFVHPIPYDSTVNLQAQIIKVKKSIYFLQAEAMQQQKIMATAKAKFIQVDFILPHKQIVSSSAN